MSLPQQLPGAGMAADLPAPSSGGRWLLLLSVPPREGPGARPDHQPNPQDHGPPTGRAWIQIVDLLS